MSGKVGSKRNEPSPPNHPMGPLRLTDLVGLGALALQAGDTSRFRITPSMAARMRELTLNERVLDKLAHITQLTAEIRQLVADGRPDELPAIESVLAPIEDHAHRLAKRLSQVPIGTVRH